MLAWSSVWGEVQIRIWLSRCHCHSLSLAPVNPDWFYLPGFTFLVPAYPGSPRQNPEIRKTVVVVVVVVFVCLFVRYTTCKNNWTDRDAAWGTEWGNGPKEPLGTYGRHLANTIERSITSAMRHVTAVTVATKSAWPVSRNITLVAWVKNTSGSTMVIILQNDIRAWLSKQTWLQFPSNIVCDEADWMNSGRLFRFSWSLVLLGCITCTRCIDVGRWAYCDGGVYFALGRGVKYCYESEMFVCLFVCSHYSKTTWPNFRKFLCMLPVAVTSSSSDSVAIRYVLPVLSMMSYFHITVQWRVKCAPNTTSITSNQILLNDKDRK